MTERSAESPPTERRPRNQGGDQARSIVEAAQRLIVINRTGFTIQQLLTEAGVALKTFYRYFDGKDQLLLAVIENMVATSCIEFRAGAATLPDPVDRLHWYVIAVLTSLDPTSHDARGPRFVTTEHWRLFPLYPDEVVLATEPFTDLLLEEIEAATQAGLLHSRNPGVHAWLVNQLVMAVYHHCAFAKTDQSIEALAQHLWEFLLAALGGRSEWKGQR